ncbi:MAG: SUMF1/EgtB/PvdO family nonheme iron enzyme [Capsulimonadaceae bacterium]
MHVKMNPRTPDTAGRFLMGSPGTWDMAQRTVRGGSFDTNSVYRFRTSFRDIYGQWNGSPHLGFRCVVAKP